MSTVISRLYNWVTDKAGGTKITASRQDGELDQLVAAVNRKVLCSGSAPSSPIAGQTWLDTTNKYLKWYRNNEWVIISVVHVGTSAPSTVQEGDLWYDTTNNLLKTYDGASWSSTTSIVSNYRSEMSVMQASTATMTVGPGSVEINGSLVSKTSNTTLTISTAGDWAGGVSQRATNTTAYVIIDASGNIKMTTTAPSHADYALSVTAANNTKRYASVSSTTYRYLGWFRMNGTGSGELDTYGVSNILDVGVRNSVEYSTAAYATGTTAIPIDDTIPQNTEGDQYMSLNFVPTNVNNKLRIVVTTTFGYTAGGGAGTVALFQDSTANALAAWGVNLPSSDSISVTHVYYMKAATVSLTTFKVRIGPTSGKNIYFNGNGALAGRFYGGVAGSSISVEEIPAQLT